MSVLNVICVQLLASK